MAEGKGAGKWGNKTKFQLPDLGSRGKSEVVGRMEAGEGANDVRNPLLRTQRPGCYQRCPGGEKSPLNDESPESRVKTLVDQNQKFQTESPGGGPN